MVEAKHDVYVPDDGIARIVGELSLIADHSCGRSSCLLKDVAQKKKALDIILGHYGRGPFEYPEGAIDEVAVVEIEIESLTGKQSGY